MTKAQKQCLLVLITKAYSNAVADMFGGFQNSEAGMLRVTKGYIDWDDFVRNHKQHLLPDFCNQKYHTVALSRKWADVRVKNKKIRDLLMQQLSLQLHGVENVDVLLRQIADEFHLSNIGKIKDPNALTRNRRGGHAHLDRIQSTSEGVVDALTSSVRLPTRSSEEVSQDLEDVRRTMEGSRDGSCDFHAYTKIEDSELLSAAMEVEAQPASADAYYDEAHNCEMASSTDPPGVLQPANMGSNSSLGIPLPPPDGAQATDSGTQADWGPAKHMMTVEDWVRAANEDLCCSALIPSLANMLATFSREILDMKVLCKIRSEADLLMWEQAESEKIMTKLARMRTDAGKVTDFCWAAREHEGWRLETNHEVLVRSGDLAPLAYVKFLVLWCEGQARLVLFDYLCRNKAGPKGLGRVGSVVVEQVVARYPLSSVILCTVKVKDPAFFQQPEEERAKAVEAYQRMGFQEMPRKGGVFRCLQPLAELPGKPPGRAGARLAALAGLVADLGDSLPMTAGHMRDTARILGWELAGRPDGEAWWAALAADPPAPLAGPTSPDWLRPGAKVEALWRGDWWDVVVVKVRPVGTRSLEALVRYVDRAGVALGQECLVCVCVCARARACVRACVRVCVCVRVRGRAVCWTVIRGGLWPPVQPRLS
jgi:hypothetical protein